MKEGFGTFDHTGDLGLEVWAESPERLYALAAEAVMAQIARPIETGATEVETGRLELEGQDPGDLLVHWLNTALLEAELARVVWTSARVERWSPTGMVASLQGVRLDPRRQEFLREIKAVSHHFLELDLEPPTCRCRLILDL